MDRKILEHYVECFNGQKGRAYPCSNQIVVCAIITIDKDKALSIMEERGAVIKWHNYNGVEWELNNEKWIWRNWSENCRGYRFYKIIVDENVDENVFRYLVLPYCAGYCCSLEII